MTIPFFVTSVISLLAIWVAYLTLLKNQQPQLLIYYQPNPDIPSIIDLVIENIGNSNAIDVNLSREIPIHCFGIMKPDGEGRFIPKTGFPCISPGQKYIFDGGQYAGLNNQLGQGLKVEVIYKYRSPLGFNKKTSELFFLSVEHLRYLPTRTSAEQAIVEALKGPNQTTMQNIRDELKKINQYLGQIAEKM